MKIALLGYGKMGKEIEQIALNRGHEIVVIIDHSNADTLNPELLKQADVAIEFSTPHTAQANMLTCFKAQVPVVVGTTGWYEKLTEVKASCEQANGGLFYASNFSIGVNILFSLNKKLASIMNHYPQYNVWMDEIHHIHKLDSPSGTGLTLAGQILEGLDRKTSWIEGKADTPEQMEIHTKREGEVPGTHIIHYQSDVDTISIGHVAHNRKGFALGAVLAAEFMAHKQGVYGMEDLLSFN